MIRYRLVGFLGEGGGVRVYRAHDLLVGIEVAIKVLNDSWDRTKRIRREIAAPRAYSHPNLVKLLDIATPALVLELAEKGELSQYLRQPLNVRLALALARQVADALCLSHESGGVHGDVKPANIFVNAGGTLKLGDFQPRERERLHRALQLCNRWNAGIRRTRGATGTCRHRRPTSIRSA